MTSTHNIIGIWGIGTVGKSVIKHYRTTTNAQLYALDAKSPSAKEKQFLDENDVLFFSQSQQDAFLQHCDLIVKSPGIDAREYPQFHHKIISELTIFTPLWHKPIIAVTGTLGKTSIVHMLTAILETAGKKIALGGNVGRPMLDLLHDQETSDYAILELSSYQLEYIDNFAPDYAIITNIYPKHLDRHETFEQYIHAKLNICKNQKPNQLFLAPTHVYQQLTALNINNKSTIRSCSVSIPAEKICITDNQDTAAMNDYYRDQQGNLCKKNTITSNSIIVPYECWPDYSFRNNWELVASTIDRLLPNFDPALLKKAPNTIPAHRGEKVATVNNIDFYDDSKSTIIQATIASIQRLAYKQIHVLVGGISDGVDRVELFEKLVGLSLQFYCFGKEAIYLTKAARSQSFNATAHETLEQAFSSAYNNAKPKECIILSPAGPSYDLFANYIERGESFCALIQKLVKDSPQN